MGKVINIKSKTVKVGGRNHVLGRFDRKSWYKKFDKFDPKAHTCYAGCMNSPLENVVNCNCPICHGALHGIATLRKLSEPAQRHEIAIVKDHFMMLAGELTTKQAVANSDRRMKNLDKRIAAKRVTRATRVMRLPRNKRRA